MSAFGGSNTAIPFQGRDDCSWTLSSHSPRPQTTSESRAQEWVSLDHLILLSDLCSRVNLRRKIAMRAIEAGERFVRSRVEIRGRPELARSCDHASARCLLCSIFD